MDQELIVFITELIGTIAFAITGVTAAIERHLDVFGALVLGTITAVGGGFIRDITLGNVPPALFENPIYTVLAVITSAIVFLVVYVAGDYLNRHMKRYYQFINISDALGLGIFCVVGVDTAIRCGYGNNVFLAVFIGTITAIGGGLLRDILARRIPRILVGQVYALAAIFGSFFYHSLRYSGIPETNCVWSTVFLVVLIRIFADHYNWNLPRI